MIFHLVIIIYEEIRKLMTVIEKSNYDDTVDPKPWSIRYNKFSCVYNKFRRFQEFRNMKISQQPKRRFHHVLVRYYSVPSSYHH